MYALPVMVISFAAPANIWNSYSEVKVFGDIVSASSSKQINLQGGLIYGTPVNPYNAPYTPANVVDGDLNTHWTGKMANSTDYKYLIIDLDKLIV